MWHEGRVLSRAKSEAAAFPYHQIFCSKLGAEGLRGLHANEGGWPNLLS